MASEATLKMILLGVDKGATSLLRRTGREADNSGSKMSKFGKLGKFAAAGVAAGLTAAAGAVVAFGKKSIDAYKEVATESSGLSRVTGLTIKQASQLRFAAEETGTKFDVLAKSMKFLAKNSSTASGQTLDFERKLKAAAAQGKTFNGHLGKQAAAFANLGVKVAKSNGTLRPMRKVLGDVADQFKKMPDGPEKTVLAMQLFGKGGADMIKLLNKGSDGLKEFAKEADKTGNSISNVNAFKKNLQAQREFHASINGLKIQLGQALYPALAAISESLATKVGPAITRMLPTIKKFGEWIQVHVVPAIRDLADKYLTSLMKGFENLKPHLKDLKPYFDAFAVVLTKVLLPAMAKMYEVILPAMGYALAGLAIGLGKVAKGAVVMWNHALQPTFRFFAQAIGKVLGGLSDMFGALSHVPKMGWAKGVARDLRNAANAAGAVANNINKIPSHKKVSFSLNISPQDRFLLTNPKAGAFIKSAITANAAHNAVGTSSWTGGWTTVGEAGREIVHLPARSHIYSATQSQRMMSASGDTAQQPVKVEINFNGVVGDPRAVVRQIQGAFREAGITSGTAVSV